MAARAATRNRLTGAPRLYLRCSSVTVLSMAGWKYECSASTSSLTSAWKREQPGRKGAADRAAEMRSWRSRGGAQRKHAGAWASR